MNIHLVNPIDNPLKCDTPIFRYLGIDTMIKMLESKTMMFRRVTAFEDPWEAAIIHQKWPDEAMQIKYKEEIEKFYANCWSRKSQKDSDALWRIYSPNRQDTCIETTVEMLGNGLEPCDIKTVTIVAIGPVVYEDQYKYNMENQFGRKYYYDYGNMIWVYNKRPAFSHEDEIRLTIQFKEAHENKLFFLEKVNYKKMIKKIWLDPRADEWYAAAVSSYIKEKYGIPCEKSTLYKAEEYRINGVNLN